MKYVKFSTILMALLLSIVPVLAQGTDLAPNEPLDGFPPPVPSMFVAINQPPAELPSDFAPIGQVCDNAADSYLSAGMEVSHVEMVNFDDIVYNNSDEAVILTALYNHLLPDLAALEKSAVMLNDANVLEPSNSVPQDTFFIGQESFCVNTEGMTVRLWDTPYGYVVENVRFNSALDMAQFWGGVGENVNPNNPPFPNNLQLNAPEFPVMVDGVTVRFLLPYVTLPPAVPIGGDTINNNVYPTPCEYGAPSYLGVGLEVEMNGHGYEEFPSNYDVNDYLLWEFDGAQLPLGEYGWARYVDFLNTTPLVGIPGNFESVLQSVEELYSGVVRPTGTIVDGPVCSSHYEYHSNDDLVEAGGDGHHFVTWWQVELDGVTGWYPESTALYAYSYELTFARRITGYYMQPIVENVMMSDPSLDFNGNPVSNTAVFIRFDGIDGESTDASAIECLPTRFVDGATVEPAQRLNLRIEPNGAVIGAVEIGEQVMLIGSPVSESGYLWWYTSRGGWIAEYDCDTNVALLLPAVQNANPETSTTGATPSDETNTEPVVTPTLAPLTATTVEPTRPPAEPTRPPRATCDPATGAGC